MKKIINIIAIVIIVLFVVACTNEDDSIISKEQSNQVGLKSEILSTKPVAHLLDGKIVLNFSQADIEKYLKNRILI
jgi:hypothetical protein